MESLPNYKKMVVRDLRKLCNAKGIPVRRGGRYIVKAELVSTLTNAGAPVVVPQKKSTRPKPSIVKRSNGFDVGGYVEREIDDVFSFTMQEQKAKPPPDISYDIPIFENIAVDDFDMGGHVEKSVGERIVPITLELFRKELASMSTIRRFKAVMEESYAMKRKFYHKKKEEAEKDEMRARMIRLKLKESGCTEREISEAVPNLAGLAMITVKLGVLIAMISKRERELTYSRVQQNLFDALDNKDNGISTIVGRDDIKNKIVAQIYAFSMGKIGFSFQNISITGPAGSGKTKLAIVMTHAFSKSGMLLTNVSRVVSRTDMVGQFIGHTAPRTKSVLMDTLEGVLFIDEAYQLVPYTNAGRDFGGEAITEIVNFVDKYIGASVVIIAGYKDKMDRFFNSNEGLFRRFPFRYDLKPYSVEELVNMLLIFIKRDASVNICRDTSNFIYSVISKIMGIAEEVFKNQAGDMLNLASAISVAMKSSPMGWCETGLGSEMENKKIVLSALDAFLSIQNIKIDFRT